MYGVLREYEVGVSVIDRLVERAQETFIPQLRRQPGFVSYSMMEDAEVQGLITLSVFEDRAGAEESTRLAAAWVKDYVLSLLPSPPRHAVGRFTVHRLEDDKPIGACVLRRYRLHANSARAFADRVSADLVPMLGARKGFAGFFVLDSGGGNLVSFSAFTDRQTATDAEPHTRWWSRAHLSDLVPAAPELISGQVKLHLARAAAR